MRKHTQILGKGYCCTLHGAAVAGYRKIAQASKLTQGKQDAGAYP